MNVELTIVMPCLNEIETIEQCIHLANRFLEENEVVGEIVIGDNGSTDGSIEAAEKLGARVVHVKQKGYGAACAGAINAAKGKYIIMGDSDMSYDFYHLMPFVEKMREGYDLVMGNRFKGGIEKGAMPFKNRYLGNPVLSLIGRVLYSSDIGDFHCGLRGFSKKAYDSMNIHSTGMEFASELVFKAQIMKIKTTEVPTTLSKDGRSRPPHLRPWRDGWRHLRLMFLFSPKYLFLVPGISLLFVGLLLMLLLVINGPISLLGIEFSNTTLVYSGTFIIAGLQAIIFALLSKYYGVREGILPADKKLNCFFKLLNVEVILLIGLAIFVMGVWGGFYSLNLWSQNNFGSIETIKMLSVVVPSSVSFVSGLLIMMFGLFVGVLNLKPSQTDDVH